MGSLDRIVADTSVIINGRLTELIESGQLANLEILVPEAAVDELQSQAAQKREEGFIGLEELQKMRSMAAAFGLQIRFVGQRPGADDVSLSDRGRIDAIIKDIAMQNEATLYTSDRVQALVAEIEGVDVSLQHVGSREGKAKFLHYFDEQTMSVHLKEGMLAMAKRGRPGSFELEAVDSTRLTREYLHRLATQILESSRGGHGIEISKPGALVVQYDDYRIAVTQPPFSERYEITIVHPIVRMSLQDYGISEKLMARLSEKAEGILISGPPGSGKSTLASSLANFYNSMGKIVKTFESPRDLQVDSAVTQYTRLDGSFENSAEILMLVRPDYTIFDEVRRREDFGTFSDLRLTGVGMVGVVHANAPLDSIQRFIGKIELGIIPSVLDTVVFVKEGRIDQVYQLELKVKVPSGMVEQDLARPVIEVRDFEGGELEYEIYTFGEENVVMPVTGGHGMHKLVEEKVRETFQRLDPEAEVEILSGNSVRVRVARNRIASIIGRGGSKISELEKRLQVSIDVQEREKAEAEQEGGPPGVPIRVSASKRSLYISVEREYAGLIADVMAGGELVLSDRIGRRGQIRLHRHSEAARKLADVPPEEIRVRLRDS